MNLPPLPIESIQWGLVEPTAHPGITGQALWRTRQSGPYLVRLAEHSPGYLADHWCEKGPILLCLEGSW